MTYLRNWLCWSFDPRTDKLDVWDSNEGREGHFQRTGNEGYIFCAQGRLYPGRYGLIYNNRPYKDTDDHKADDVRAEGLARMKAHMTEQQMPSVAFYESS